MTIYRHQLSQQPELARELVRVEEALDDAEPKLLRLQEFSELDQVETRGFTGGELARVGGTLIAWDPDANSGVGAWAMVTRLGYGAAFGGPQLLGTVGSAAWVNLAPYTGAFEARGVVWDLPNGLFAPERAGIYNLQMQATLEHNEQNSSRSLTFGLFNATQGTQVGGWLVGTARNQSYTRLTFGAALPVASPGEAYQWRIIASAGDTYSGVDMASINVSLNSQVEYPNL